MPSHTFALAPLQPVSPADRARTGGRLRCAAWALGIALLSACAEGYPPSDVPVMDPSQFTQQERVDAMNYLGRTAYPQRRWTYDLADDCVLAVATRRHRDGRVDFHLPLRGKTVRAPLEPSSQLYEVQLSAAQKAPVTILQSAEWVDAILMRGLIQAIQIDCQQGHPAARHAPNDTETLPPHE